jgi:hypothetical protein
MKPIRDYVAELIQRCPGIDSVWLMGDAASDIATARRWELVAFADSFTAARIRKSTDLHRGDVTLRIVTDGDRFEIAWGALAGVGSLMSLDWSQTAFSEAHYNEVRWDSASDSRNVQRTRRRAVRLWSAGRAVAGAHAGQP